MADHDGVRGRTVFVAVLVALLLGALLVLWIVVELAVGILAVILAGGLIVIAGIYWGLRSLFRD